MCSVTLSWREVDKLIHEPVRFEIMRILYSAQNADFVYMQRQIEINQGKLSSDLARLREAGYIQIHKTFQGRIPITICKLTKKGRSAYESYIQHMKQKLANLPEFGVNGQLRSSRSASSLSRRVKTGRTRMTQVMSPQTPQGSSDSNL